MNPDEITPPELKTQDDGLSRDSAVSAIRHKLDSLYQNEPNAEQEAAEVKNLNKNQMSKHQKYMKHLNESGMQTHQIQTAWHEYYQSLSTVEKHEVWKEFYSEQADKKAKEKHARQQHERHQAELEAKQIHEASLAAQSQNLNQENNTEQIIPHSSRHRKTARHHNQTHPAHHTAAPKKSKLHKVKNNQHFKSLVFGLSMGTTVVFILLFSFFNERFIIPFIRPAGNVSATPIIIDPTNTGPVGKESKIIIPKINVEAPVIFDVKTVQEEDVQAGLERGVVHYPTTSSPGEKGNSVIFGHSSGNILNKGSYKFAFLLLKSLEKGDTFIVQKDSKRYVYKIYNKFVTTPDDFSVLDPSDRPAITTLITCDPPGTSTNRLIVQAEQIFPNPSTNKASSVKKVIQPEQLPSNSKSLWSRIVGWF